MGRSSIACIFGAAALRQEVICMNSVEGHTTSHAHDARLRPSVRCKQILECLMCTVQLVAPSNFAAAIKRTSVVTLHSDSQIVALSNVIVSYIRHAAYDGLP